MVMTAVYLYHYLYSWNHGVVWVGGLLQDHPVQFEIIFPFIMTVCGVWFYIFTNIPGAAVIEAVSRLVRDFLFLIKKVL